MPRISVILPTWNRAAALPRAIASVLAQSHADLELIVVDDASTDATAAVVGKFGDERLRYVRRERRGGAGAARNTGLSVARGELVAFQDSDDEWLLHKLATQLRLLEAAPADTGLAYCRMLRWSGDATHCVPALNARSARDTDIRQSILRRNFISTQTWLARRECFAQVGGFNEDLPALEDWDWMIRFAGRYRVVLADEVLVVAFESLDSLSRDVTAQMRATEEMLRIARSSGRAKSLGLANLVFLLGARHFMHGDAARGRRHLLEAFRMYPLAPRFALGLLLTLAGRRLFHACWTYARHSPLKDAVFRL